jgi:protocatechuate 3,4-dioxygenase beta subunit
MLLTPKTRREVIKCAIATAGLAALDPLAFAFGEPRPATPALTLGPFYPLTKPLDKDADLTLIAGKRGHAHGQLIHVVGRVVNRNGDPVRNAKVELWQANAAGRYSHPSDQNTAPLDPNFQGYGEQMTDADGHFRFKTIKPGAYPTLDGIGMRTPHIHFEIRGKNDLLATQMFFEGEPLNDEDFIYRGIRRNAEGTIAKVHKEGPGLEPGAWLVSWDVVLMRG